jgi:hypothetical protein
MPDLDLIKQGEHGARPAPAVCQGPVEESRQPAAATIRLAPTALNVLRWDMPKSKFTQVACQIGMSALCRA